MEGTAGVPLLLAPGGVSWENPDVTPVGVVRHADGASVSRRVRGWGRIVVGGLLVAVGLVLGVVGIVDSVDHRSDALDGAVGRGVLQGVGPTDPVQFLVTEREADFTIYLDTPDAGNSVNLEREVQSTVCTIEPARGPDVTVRGSRQGVASDIGGLLSIGGFTATEGQTTVTCGWNEPTRFDRGRADQRDFVVSPGKPSEAATGVTLVLVGVAASLAGCALLVWGLIGKHELARRPDR